MRKNFLITVIALLVLVSTAHALSGLNIISERRYFDVDNTPPYISITNPGEDAVYNSSSVLLNFTLIDTISDNATCNYTLDDSLFEIGLVYNNTPNITILSGLMPATHSVNVTCFDQGGNQNTSDTVNFDIYQTS